MRNSQATRRMKSGATWDQAQTGIGRVNEVIVFRVSENQLTGDGRSVRKRRLAPRLPAGTVPAVPSPGRPAGVAARTYGVAGSGRGPAGAQIAPVITRLGGRRLAEYQAHHVYAPPACRAWCHVLELQPTV